MEQISLRASILVCAAILAAACFTGCGDGGEEDDEPRLPADAGEILMDMRPNETLLWVAEIDRAVKYKWYRDGIAVHEGERPSYVATQSGSYSVAGLNIYGEGKSSPAKAVPIVPEFNILSSEYIPDARFLAYLRSELSYNEGYYSNIQAAAYKGGFYVTEREIASLEGISYFPILDELDCTGNELTELDLSGNPALTGLDCKENKLRSLDIGKCTELWILNANDNELRSVDLSSQSKLTNLYLGSNELTVLDVINMPDLAVLRCDDNMLEELDLSGNPALEGLNCNGNLLRRLDISANTALERLRCMDNPELTEIKVWADFDMDNPPAEFYKPDEAVYVYEFTD